MVIQLYRFIYIGKKCLVFFFFTFNNSEKLGVFIAYVQMDTISGAQWSGTILEAQWVQFQMGTISAALKTINGNTYHIIIITGDLQ